MTVWMIIGLVLLPFVWAMQASANKQHIAETGVPAPSRKAMARIRRNSRHKGISEQAAYEQWVGNKQRRMKISAPAITGPHLIADTAAGRSTAVELSSAAGGGSGWVMGFLACVALILGAVALFAEKEVPAPAARTSRPDILPPNSPAPIVPVQAQKASYELPKLNSGVDAALPRPEIKVPPVVSSRPVASSPPAQAERSIRAAAIVAPKISRRRGGCGSRGGAGYRLPSGKCASRRH